MHARNGIPVLVSALAVMLTAAPSRAQEIEAALEGLGTSAQRIGQLVAGKEVVVRRDGMPYAPPARGYRHF